MAATNQNVTHYQGDSGVLRIGPLVDENGDAIDVTGATARWWLAKAVNSTGDGILLQRSTDDLTGMEFEVDTDGATIVITLAPGDTEALKPGILYHECELAEQDGTISTIMTGKFTLVGTLIRNA